MLKRLLTKVINKFIKKEIIPIYRPLDCNTLLEGKIVMITGGTGGIGSAIAKNVVNCGGKVILCGRNEQKIAQIQSQLGENVKGFKMH